MEARDEAASLKTDPLPTLVVKEDRTIPTQIHFIDGQIEDLENQITILREKQQKLTEDREGLLQHAVETCILEDDFYRIVPTPVYGNKTVDIAILEQHYPDQLTRIRENLKAAAEEKMKAQLEKAGTFIAQSDVKAIIKGKKDLDRIIHAPADPVRTDYVLLAKEEA